MGREYIQTGYYTEVYFAQKKVRYIAVNEGIVQMHIISKKYIEISQCSYYDMCMKYRGETMYKACIFDLDGTLTDTLESLTFSVNETLRELHLQPITGRQCESFVGNGAKVLVEKSLQVAGDRELVHLEEALDIYGRIFKENCTYHVKLYDGILEMIQTLKSKGVKLAVLTNKPHLQALDVVFSFFGKDIFSDIRGQKEGVPRKPDPTAAIMIAEEFQAECRECVYIGDSEVDMQTGRAAGMKTVGVTWGFRDRQALVMHGAEHIIDNPQELLAIVEGKE